jgi:hypothetical protein
LEPILFGLGEWGARWTFGTPREDERDPALQVWWMHTRVDTSSFPGRRHVLLVRFTDDPRRFWIVLEAGVPSVCESDPGYPVDVAISSDVASQVWLGRLAPALRAGRVAFTGPPALTRRMPSVLRLSPVAGYADTSHVDAAAQRAY